MIHRDFDDRVRDRADLKGPAGLSAGPTSTLNGRLAVPVHASYDQFEL